ncbi:hypothetical protein DLAC_11528 [Tieghemostelium lacteum]|uniref:DOMON domain-containing protein n=1 Tax=Tieghemostelium lacteum TaxID=361077 RepID=A0A152A3K4_TIELA|nr:hypothetical protein DLAC_11528 [Tieghemostelium lacteum]|eukprot:KYR00631.1 hypothetical protein DLAC_11528 [Tieghemostelium lacteum]
MYNFKLTLLIVTVLLSYGAFAYEFQRKDGGEWNVLQSWDKSLQDYKINVGRTEELILRVKGRALNSFGIAITSDDMAESIAIAFSSDEDFSDDEVSDGNTPMTVGNSCFRDYLYIHIKMKNTFSGGDLKFSFIEKDLNECFTITQAPGTSTGTAGTDDSSLMTSSEIEKALEEILNSESSSVSKITISYISILLVCFLLILFN